MTRYYKQTIHNGRRTTTARAAMEARLKRELYPWETVRFRSEDRTNTTTANLQLWVGPVRGGIPASDAFCPHCNHRLYDGKKLDEIRKRGRAISRDSETNSDDISE
jgi:hypothetical protein